MRRGVEGAEKLKFVFPIQADAEETKCKKKKKERSEGFYSNKCGCYL